MGYRLYLIALILLPRLAGALSPPVVTVHTEEKVGVDSRETLKRNASGTLVCPNVVLTSGSAVHTDVLRITVSLTAKNGPATVLDKYEHVFRFGGIAAREMLTYQLTGGFPDGGMVLLVLDQNLPFEAGSVVLAQGSSLSGSPTLLGYRKRSLTPVKAATLPLPAKEGHLIRTDWTERTIPEAGDEGAPLFSLMDQAIQIFGVLVGHPEGWKKRVSVFLPVFDYLETIRPVMKKFCGKPPRPVTPEKLAPLTPDEVGAYSKKLRRKISAMRNLNTPQAIAAVRCASLLQDQIYSAAGRLLGDYQDERYGSHRAADAAAFDKLRLRVEECTHGIQIDDSSVGFDEPSGGGGGGGSGGSGGSGSSDSSTHQ